MCQSVIEITVRFDKKSMSKKKLTHPIRFPLSLDIGPFIDKECVATETHFTLCAILLHRGPSANAGHYIAHTFDSAVCC